MTIVPRITCANLRKSSRPSPSVTAIGFKGQRNNNRGGGRRPGFEATYNIPKAGSRPRKLGMRGAHACWVGCFSASMRARRARLRACTYYHA